MWQNQSFPFPELLQMSDEEKRYIYTSFFLMKYVFMFITVYNHLLQYPCHVCTSLLHVITTANACNYEVL